MKSKLDLALSELSFILISYVVKSLIIRSMHVYVVINCLNAKLFRKTLPVAPAVRFKYGILCNDVGQYVTAT